MLFSQTVSVPVIGDVAGTGLMMTNFDCVAPRHPAAVLSKTDRIPIPIPPQFTVIELVPCPDEMAPPEMVHV